MFYLKKTTGRIRSCLTQTRFYASLNPNLNPCRQIFFELGRQRKPASVRVALAAFPLATLDPATRSSADVVICYGLRLPTTDFHDLIHRRPGQGSGEGATNSKGVHREMARQARLSQMDLQGNAHTGCGEGPKIPAPLRRNHGENMPAGEIPFNPLRGGYIRRPCCGSNVRGLVNIEEHKKQLLANLLFRFAT